MSICSLAFCLIAISMRYACAKTVSTSGGHHWSLQKYDSMDTRLFNSIEYPCAVITYPLAELCGLGLRTVVASFSVAIQGKNDRCKFLLSHKHANRMLLLAALSSMNTLWILDIHETRLVPITVSTTVLASVKAGVEEWWEDAD